MNHFNISNYSAVVLLIWFLIDALTMLMPQFNDLKAPLKFIFFIPLLLKFKNFKSIEHFAIVLIVSTIAIMLFIAYPGSYNSSYSARLAGFVIVCMAFYYSFTSIDFNCINLITLARIVLIVISITSIINYFFVGRGVYGSGTGFSGVGGGFDSGNEYTYLVIILTAIFLVEMVSHNHLTIKNFFWISISVTNCILLSTKSVYLYLVMVMLFFAILYKKFLYCIIIALTIGYLFISEDFFDNFNLYTRFLWLADQYDLSYSLTSGRSERLEDFDFLSINLLPAENNDKNFEMELLDAVTNLGLIGLIVLLTLVLKIFIYIRTSNVTLYLTSLIAIISIVSGHLLNAVSVGPIFALYLSLFSEKLSRKKNINDN